jgi:hypothetical protein
MGFELKVKVEGSVRRPGAARSEETMHLPKAPATETTL